MNRRKGLVVETIVFILLALFIIAHLIYRNNYETRGWLVFDGSGSIFLVREKDVADKCAEDGYSIMPYHGNDINSFELYDENFNTIARLVIDGREEFRQIDQSVIDEMEELFSTQSSGSLKLSNVINDTLTIDFTWISTDAGERCLVIKSSSQAKRIALSVDAVLNYMTYVLVMILIVRSICCRGRLNIAEYRNLQLEGNCHNDET